MRLDEATLEMEKIRDDPYLYFQDADEKQLRLLQTATHPDRYANQPTLQAGARQLFTELAELQEQATNVRHLAGARLVSKIARGDLCDVYKAHTGDRYVLLKSPRAKAGALMRKAGEVLPVLRQIGDPAKLLFPEFLEAKAGCNLFVFEPQLQVLLAASQRYKGIPPRHIVWIFRRIMLALARTHDCGYVHGAITPEHVLLDPADHGIRLVSWIHSGKPGEPLQLVPATYRAMYPDWIVASKKLDPSLDIAMAAATCLQIGEPELPKPMRAFLKGCTTATVARHTHAYELIKRMGELAKRMYGRPTFVPFT